MEVIELDTFQVNDETMTVMTNSITSNSFLCYCKTKKTIINFMMAISAYKNSKSMLCR